MKVEGTMEEAAEFRNLNRFESWLGAHGRRPQTAKSHAARMRHLFVVFDGNEDELHSQGLGYFLPMGKTGRKPYRGSVKFYIQAVEEGVPLIWSDDWRDMARIPNYERGENTLRPA